jgi:hypothetical protein
MARVPATRSARSDINASRRIDVRFKRVIVVIVVLENYRKPSSDNPLPTVSYAHADVDAFADWKITGR